MSKFWFYFGFYASCGQLFYKIIVWFFDQFSCLCIYSYSPLKEKGSKIKQVRVMEISIKLRTPPPLPFFPMKGNFTTNLEKFNNTLKDTEFYHFHHAYQGREMAGILNAQYTSVFTSEDTTRMPEPELLYTGENPLNVVRFQREEVEKKLRK